MYDPQSYIVTEIPDHEVEHIVLSSSYAGSAQYVIDTEFDGDVEGATRFAAHQVATTINPPQWCLDLAGPRMGWKDPARRRY